MALAIIGWSWTGAVEAGAQGSCMRTPGRNLKSGTVGRAASMLVTTVLAIQSQNLVSDAALYAYYTKLVILLLSDV